MEWLNGPVEDENMEVDIGFIPQMELKHTLPSAQVPIFGENGEAIFEPPPAIDIGPIIWDAEITTEEARGRMEAQLYPFKKVCV